MGKRGRSGRPAPRPEPEFKTMPVAPGEDWSPNLPGNLVECRMYLDWDTAGSRISIVGGDDTCMARYGMSKEEAWRIWYALPNPMAFEWLERNGFNYD